VETCTFREHSTSAIVNARWHAHSAMLRWVIRELGADESKTIRRHPERGELHAQRFGYGIANVAAAPCSRHSTLRGTTMDGGIYSDERGARVVVCGRGPAGDQLYVE